jgi:type III secretory pathway component EscV
VKIEYQSGNQEASTTGGDGIVSFVANETGTLNVTVSMAGYDTYGISLAVNPGFNWLLLVFVVVAACLALGGFLYWRQMSPIRLTKNVSGQIVTLKVKNRTGERLENVLIMDTVPAGAFVSCDLNPKIETFGNEDHLTWFATMELGEEIEINYQATSTSDSFLVRVDHDEYHSR